MRLWAEISFSRFNENVKRIREIIHPSELMFVVKANAYGHGIEQAVKLAEKAEIRWLGVTSAAEASTVLENLRSSRHSPKILCFFEPEDKDELEFLIQNGVSFNIFSKSLLKDAVKVSEKLNRPALLHIKVNTGMNRLGAPEKQVVELAEEILSEKNLVLEGFWSHLATAENPKDDFAYFQIDKFNKVSELIKKKANPLLHIANTGGALYYPEARFDLVRVGIGAYGYLPSLSASNDFGLVPILKLKARITAVHRLQEGEGVSYGLRFKADKPCNVGIVAAGYADGIPYSASGKIKVCYKGKIYNQVGSICMDQFAVNFEDVRPYPGEVVEIISDDFDAREMAVSAGTITYEVLTHIGERVKRVLVD